MYTNHNQHIYTHIRSPKTRETSHHFWVVSDSYFRILTELILAMPGMVPWALATGSVKAWPVIEDPFTDHLDPVGQAWVFSQFGLLSMPLLQLRVVAPA